MLRGGKSGPAMVPGKPGESLVLKKIHDGEMPPRRKVVQASVKPMEPSEIALLTKWIELGAPVGEAPKPKPYPIKKADLEFWAFQKPQRPAVPAICRCLPICRSTALSGSSKEKLNFKPWIVNLSRPELD